MISLLRTSLLGRAALFLLVVTGAAGAMAAPIRYDFTTGPLNALATPPPLRTLLAGPVTGSLVYDAAVPLTATFTNPAQGFGPTPSAFFSGALVSIEGKVDGRTFSDATGDAGIVTNDAFTLPTFVSPVPVDLFTLLSDPFAFGTGAPRSLVGFTVGDFVLVNVRMFWLEVLVPGTPDFLASSDLPAEPPGIPGRLAFDFVTRAQFAAGTPAPVQSLFFDGVRVTRAQVPAPFGLPVVAVAALLLLRRRRG